jgi:hypothetical protein
LTDPSAKLDFRLLERPRGWLDFLDTVRTERFEDVFAFKPLKPFPPPILARADHRE